MEIRCVRYIICDNILIFCFKDVWFDILQSILQKPFKSQLQSARMHYVRLVRACV